MLPINFEVLPGLLRGEALRNWLRTDGAAIFSIFDTGAKAYKFIEDLGVQIRTQDFYAIRREVLSAIESSDNLRGYPGDQLIPLKWHTNEHGLDLSSKYMYRIELFGADTGTGILKKQWMSVASDRQLTLDEIKDVATSYVGEGGTSGEIEDYYFGDIEALRR